MLATIGAFLGATASAEQRTCYLSLVGKYIEHLTPERLKILAAACTVASVAPSALDKLCLDPAMQGDGVVAAFVENLAEAVEGLKPDLRSAYLELCILIGGQSLAAGSHVAANAWQRLGQVEEDDRGLYLSICQRIAAAHGAYMVEFLLTQLPLLITSLDRETLCRLVDGTCAIGSGDPVGGEAGEAADASASERRSKEAEDLLEQLAVTVPQLAPDIVEPYVDLCFLIAQRSIGSAAFVADHARKSLKKIPQGDQEYYLQAFRRIVDAVGPCMVGFSLRRLPGMVTKARRDSLDHFINTACLVAAGYGWRAAADFMERKTPTSRALWPKDKT